MASFGEAERRIASLLSVGKTFKYGSDIYTVCHSGKPTCSSGEPKTDIYVYATSDSGKKAELKISFKKENADFLENKTSEERAWQLFGESWKDIITCSTHSIRDSFLNRPLIYKSSYRRTSAGAITLGWRFELLNKHGGDLSSQIRLSHNQTIDVYAGTNLDDDKKHAFVGAERVNNSGIANCILAVDDIRSTQDIINNIYPIREYVKKYPNVYFACKALNYRTFEGKWDGNRPLAVYINWRVNNGKLTHEYVFDNPLTIRGNHVAQNLLNALRQLRVSSTIDLNAGNVADPGIIWG